MPLAPMALADIRPRRSFFTLCLGAAVVLGTLAGCGSAPRRTDPIEAQTSPAPASLTLEQANEVTLYAISLVGTPYRFGGNTPESGFDCSGLIHHVYQSRAALRSPRTVAALKHWGQAVTAQDLRSGDLVVFFQRNEADHAGIYVGQGRFVHAPSSGGRVRLDHLSSRYWAAQPVAFRRP